MRHYAMAFLMCLLAPAFCGLAATDNPMQWIEVSGCKLTETGGLQPIGSFGGLSVTPGEGVVYSNGESYADNKNVFTATVPFGYRVGKWKKAFDDPFVLTKGEDVEGSEGATSVTIPWEDRGNVIYLALILEYDDNRTVTIGKTPFGAGTVGTNLGTYACLKGDVFQLNAVPEHDSQTGFDRSTFRRWSDGVTASRRTVTVDTNLTLVAEFVPKSWEVSFDANGGTVSPTSKWVTCDATYGWLPTPVKFGNRFDGWYGQADDGAAVGFETTVGAVGNHLLHARWTPMSYTVGFVASGKGNGVVEGTGTYPFNSEVELVAKPYEGSVFGGWGDDDEARNPRRVTVTSNIVYDARFDVATYDVTFTYRNAEGREVVSPVQKVGHGEAATPPAASECDNWPYHYFKTWSSADYAKVTRNLTGSDSVRAIYEDEKFDVTFVYRGRDGNAVTTMPQVVVAGASATPPPDSVADNWPGHKRIGWQPDYSVILSNLTVTAVYDEYCTVDYAVVGEGNGMVEGIGQYLAGQTVELTAKPYEGSVFAGWADGETRNPRRVTVTSNAVYGAVFDVATYDVTFTYRDTTGREVVSDVQTVRYGGAAVPPDVSAVDSWPYHVFKTWSSEDYKAVKHSLTGDRSVTAIYDSETFDVVFVYRGRDGNAVTTMPQHVVAEAAATPPPDSVADNWAGHKRVDWQPDFSVIRSDLTVEAVYEEYGSISFVISGDGNGTVEGTGQYRLGMQVTLTAKPDEGSVFAGWSDGETSNPRRLTVTSNAVYGAVFDVATYDVTFAYRDADGKEVVSDVQTVRYGEAAVPPDVSAVDSWPYHSFKTWSTDEYKAVKHDLTGDRSVAAIYDEETFAVTFVYRGRDGSEVTTMPQHVVAGKAATPPPDSVANNWAGHTRVDWQPDYSVIRSDLTVTAVYAENPASYTVDYAVVGEGNGKVEGIGQYLAGQAVELTAKPYEGSVFAGWEDGETSNPRRVTVTSNAVYGAVFDVATYDVTFTYRDTTGREVVSDVQTVRYGEAAVPPDVSAVDSWPYHSFKTWSTDEYKAVKHDLTGDRSVAAIYDEETFAVTFVYRGRDGSEVTTMPQHVVAGKAATPPPDSVANNWAGHTRVDWQPDYSVIRSNLTVTAVYAENPASYTVDYDLLGEGNGKVEGIGQYLEGQTVELTAKPYEGSVFAGWEDGETRNPRRVTVTSNAVYGVWFDVATFDVTFAYRNAQGREVVTNVPNVRYGAAVEPPDASEYDSWPEHTFKTWSTDEYKAVKRNLTGDQSVRAIYDVQTYMVTFVYRDHDGNAVTTMPQYVEAGTAAVPPKDDVANNWAGHTRVGWQPDYNVIRSDLTVEAVYAEDQEICTVDCTVSGDGKGRVDGTGSYLLDATATLTATPEEGNVFVCWENGETSNPRSVTVTSNAVYDARFDVVKPDEYTRIIYYANGGKGEMPTEVYTNYSGEVKLAKNAFTKTGYVFQYWTNTTDQVGGAAGEVVDVQKGKDYHFDAHWEPISYNLEFDGNGGMFKKDEVEQALQINGEKYEDIDFVDGEEPGKVKAFTVKNLKYVDEISITWRPNFWQGSAPMLGWSTNQEEVEHSWCKQDDKMTVKVKDLTTVDAKGKFYAIWKEKKK